MLLPSLHDELVRAAAAPHPVRRLGGRTVSALTAAFLTLMVAAPVANAQLSEFALTVATNHLRGLL